MIQAAKKLNAIADYGSILALSYVAAQRTFYGYIIIQVIICAFLTNVRRHTDRVKYKINWTAQYFHMGEVSALADKLQCEVIPADATSVEDLENVFKRSHNPGHHMCVSYERSETYR